MAQTAAAIRHKGALLALAGASVLVLVFFPAVEASKFGVLAPYVVLLLGCTTVLLSPAHRAVADLARRPAEAAQEIFGAPPTAARAATELRWAGFTCILFYAVYAAGDKRARAAAAAKEMSVEGICGLFLFLVFLVGVWTVSLSMLTGRGARPAAAEEEHDGGEVSGMVAGVAHAVA